MCSERQEETSATEKDWELPFHIVSAPGIFAAFWTSTAFEI
jgi:hypothetical protein